MSNQTNRRIVMAARPEGAPRDGDFRLEETAVPEPGAGELLCRTLYLSLDPYMRGRMAAAKSYAPRVELGELMAGGAVSEVLRSNLEDFQPGDIVFAYSGWQDYWTAGAQGLRKVDPEIAPISTALGVLGMPGMTAYTGLYNIGQPKAGETLVVAAASGPVGSLVGQIAKIEGLRVVGIAGAAEKCAYVTGELGFDACLNHREADFADKLAQACPDGIDIYWENVGGAVFEAVLPRLNRFARVPVCGLIAQYNAPTLKAGEPPPGPNRIPQLMRAVLTDRLLIRGFIVWDFADQEAEFRDTVAGWLRAHGRTRFLLTAPPLRLPGAVGSPATPVATV